MIKDRLILLLNRYIQEDISEIIEVPPDRSMGDFALPCFRLGKDPVKKAKELKCRIKIGDIIKEVSVKGPYLNIRIDSKELASRVLPRIFEGKICEGICPDKRIVIDYSSPNIAKPFGIGHLRSTVIGNSLKRLFSCMGYEVISENHLGDWGTQFGKLIAAYKRWGDEKRLEDKPIKYLLELYIRFHKEAEKDKRLNEAARSWFNKLEKGDPAAVKLWELFKEISIKEFKKVYGLLDIEFDHYHGESFYQDKLDDTYALLKSKLEVVESDGAEVIRFKDIEAPAIIIKSDGSSTYLLRDIAAALYRAEEYKADKIVYVVGSEQRLHMDYLSRIMNLLGYKDLVEHVEFGLIRFPEGKMSTRKGNIIFLEDVLDTAIKEARNKIEEKNPKLKNKEGVSMIVGIGAVIFGDLSNDRIKNIVFDWDKFLDFEGETAPYLQYTYVRCNSILSKAGKAGCNVDFSLIDTAEEKDILLHLDIFEDMINRSVRYRKPHILAGYLISLGQKFNESYHKHKVIVEDEELRYARVLLVYSVREILKKGLYLLGISVPEKM